jgi:hypothetical protein
LQTEFANAVVCAESEGDPVHFGPGGVRFCSEDFVRVERRATGLGVAPLQ